MILDFIKGIIIGLALVIPGLSGSTFALVVGLYDKLIFAINGLRTSFRKNFLYLLPIGIGAAIGILLSASFIMFLIEYFPLESYAFFIGLVIGSLPTIYKKMQIKTAKPHSWLLFVFGFILIILVTFIVPSNGGDIVAIHSIDSIGDFITILTAGIIACFLIAVPGVSGSIILMLLGQFGTVYGAVSNFADVIFMLIRGQQGAMALGIDSLYIVLTFLLGAIIGLVTAAKIIGYLIERFSASVYFVVMGLIVGAIYTLFNIGIQGYLDYLGIVTFITMPIFVILGYICTNFIGKDRQATK